MEPPRLTEETTADPPQERYSPIYSLIGSLIAVATLCGPMYLTLEYSSVSVLLKNQVQLSSRLD